MMKFIALTLQMALNALAVHGIHLYDGSLGDASITTNSDLLFDGCTFPHTVDVVINEWLVSFRIEPGRGNTTYWQENGVYHVTDQPDSMRGTYAGTL